VGRCVQEVLAGRERGEKKALGEQTIRRGWEKKDLDPFVMKNHKPRQILRGLRNVGGKIGVSFWGKGSK